MGNLRGRHSPSGFFVLKNANRRNLLKRGAAASPTEVIRKRRGRKSTNELLQEVVSAVKNLQQLDELEESPLGRLAAVRNQAEGAYRQASFPTALAIRSLVYEAADSLGHDLQDIPRYAREMRFLRAYLDGDNVTNISRTLQLTREHVARTVQPRALDLLARAFMARAKGP